MTVDLLRRHFRQVSHGRLCREVTIPVLVHHQKVKVLLISLRSLKFITIVSKESNQLQCKLQRLFAAMLGIQRDHRILAFLIIELKFVLLYAWVPNLNKTANQVFTESFFGAIHIRPNLSDLLAFGTFLHELFNYAAFHDSCYRAKNAVSHSDVNPISDLWAKETLQLFQKVEVIAYQIHLMHSVPVNFFQVYPRTAGPLESCARQRRGWNQQVFGILHCKNHRFTFDFFEIFLKWSNRDGKMQQLFISWRQSKIDQRRHGFLFLGLYCRTGYLHSLDERGVLFEVWDAQEMK
jgi:hypothetical protein